MNSKERKFSSEAVRNATLAIESGGAANGLHVPGSLKWQNRREPLHLPRGLSCYSLTLEGCALESLPEGLNVQFRLSLRDCKHLTRLPAGLKAGAIDLAGCSALESLPEGFETCFLDISNCPQLRTWPSRAALNVGRLRARNCTGITGLPPWITRLAQLDLSGCANVRELPAGLEISSWIDVAGTGICELPASCADAALRWRGIPIDARIAFRPEEITAAEILAEPNAELRRVKLERMGFERFLAEAQSETLDTDRDAGGERKLLRVALGEDEPLVCVSVFCPSTARQYIIRVPPTMQTCRQAVAWTAGFDDANDYRPLVET